MTIRAKTAAVKNLALSMMICACGAGAHADDYPSRPITLVVPSTAGGGIDIGARLIAPHLSERLGQPVIVLNKPGAGTALASDFVAKADPDGYTLLIQANALAALGALNSNISFDAKTDFTYIAQYAHSAMVLVVNPAVFPVQTFDEMVAAVRAQPGKLNYSSAGRGTPYHLGMEMLKYRLKLDIVHVPFIGGSAAMNALVNGQVQMEVATINDVVPWVESGKIKLIAVSGKNRPEQLASAPTFAEVGLKDVDIGIYFFLAGPAGLPANVTKKLNAEVARAIQDPNVRKRLIALGVTPESSSAEEIGAKVRADVDRWKAFISDAKIATQ